MGVHREGQHREPYGSPLKMPAPLARGIIIAATIVVAAGLAAYENPEVRAWIDRTRHKIAMGLHNLGDEINPKQRPRTHRPSTDASMHEEKGDLAEARRMEAIAEIMERGRIMEERRKRRKLSTEKSRKSSFDTLVDEKGNLGKCKKRAQRFTSLWTKAFLYATFLPALLIRRRTPPSSHDMNGRCVRLGIFRCPTDESSFLPVTLPKAYSISPLLQRMLLIRTIRSRPENT